MRVVALALLWPFAFGPYPLHTSVVRAFRGTTHATPCTLLRTRYNFVMGREHANADSPQLDPGLAKDRARFARLNTRREAFAAAEARLTDATNERARLRAAITLLNLTRRAPRKSSSRSSTFSPPVEGEDTYRRTQPKCDEGPHDSSTSTRTSPQPHLPIAHEISRPADQRSTRRLSSTLRHNQRHTRRVRHSTPDEAIHRLARDPHPRPRKLRRSTRPRVERFLPRLSERARILHQHRPRFNQLIRQHKRARDRPFDKHPSRA